MEKYNLYVVLTRTNSIVSQMIHFVTKDQFTHSAISFHKDLREMYSFARKYANNPFIGRFRTEELDKGLYGRQKTLPGAVIELDVTKEQYEKARAIVDEFIKNSSKYKYNYIGLLNSWLGRNVVYEYRFVCSEFVYHVLHESGVVDFNVSRNLVTPLDLLRVPGKIIYKGDLKRYHCTLAEVEH